MTSTNVVLVTGASSGIGYSLCHQFAKGGCKNLIVTARREQQLTELKNDIESSYNQCTVHVITLDLSGEAAADELYSAVHSLGLELDVLVNNAGYALEGVYFETSWQDQADLIQVLGTAPAKIIHLFLPGMVKRGSGGIINVASIAGFCPGSPHMTLYGALKHFLLSMTHALSEELKGTGVTVTAVCPGPTDTEWVDNSGSRGLFDRMPKALILSPDEVAKQGYEGFMKGKTVVVTGLGSKIVSIFTTLLPSSMTLSQLAKGYR